MKRFIKAVGAGVKRARALSREEAREAMELIASGSAEPVQVGAFLLALRMRGEVAEEMAGFAEALAAHVLSVAAPPGLLEVEAQGDGHGDAPSLLPAAACAAAALGVPVCLNVDRASPFARHGLDGALAALGVTGRLDPARAARDLARAGVAACDLADRCPPLARLVALRPLLGVRTAAQTVAKLVSSFAPAPRHRVIGIFHAPYLESTARALGLLGVEHGLVVQALGGLPEARPGKIVRVADALGAGARTIDFRGFAAGAATLGDASEQGGSEASAQGGSGESAAGDVSDRGDGATHAKPMDGGPANLAALDGIEPFVTRAAVAAGLLLHAVAGTDPVAAAAEAHAALADGRARRVAERLR